MAIYSRSGSSVSFQIYNGCIWDIHYNKLFLGGRQEGKRGLSDWHVIVKCQTNEDGKKHIIQ